MTSPVGRRRLLRLATDRGLSARAARRLLGLSRRIAHYRLRQPEKDRPVLAELAATSQRFPRFISPCPAALERHAQGRATEPPAPWRSYDLSVLVDARQVPLQMLAADVVMPRHP